MRTATAISGEEFRDWQKRAGLSAAEAAAALGKGCSSVSIYRKRGIAAEHAKLFRLAMGAIAARVAPWEQPK